MSTLPPSPREASFWQAIVDDGYRVPAGARVSELTVELLALLGSPDPLLRDQLAFEILSAWLTGGLYSPDDCRRMGAQLIGNLSAGLGETETDAVFLRSFSVLILEKILEADASKPFLTAAEVHDWLEAFLSYFLQERDLRGYVPEKGWAHPVAHSADLLMGFALNQHIQPADLERMLNAVTARLAVPVRHTYLYLEDERLAFAVIVALQRNLLDRSFLRGWVERLAHPLGNARSSEILTDPDRLGAYQNTRQFLRSLYFQLAFGIRTPGWMPDAAPFERPAQVREALLPILRDGIRAMDLGFYRPAG